MSNQKGARMVAPDRSLESAPRFQPGLPDMSKPPSQQWDGPVWIRSSNLEQNSGARERNHQIDNPPAVLSVVELWLCFILGLICMICGILGLCTAPNQTPPWVNSAWLRAAYVPALRVTAVACILMGAILGRKGWTQK
jgi:hypothetical protein